MSKPRSVRAAGLSQQLLVLSVVLEAVTSHPGSTKTQPDPPSASELAKKGIDRLSARLASFTHRDHTSIHASAAARRAQTPHVHAAPTAQTVVVNQSDGRSMGYGGRRGADALTKNRPNIPITVIDVSVLMAYFKQHPQSSQFVQQPP